MKERSKLRIAGALFIVATISYASGSAVIAPLLNSSGDISSVLIVGALLEFVDAVAVVGIATLLFSTLKQYSRPIAWTYLGTRLLEAAFITVSITSIFFNAPFWYEYTFQIAVLILGLGSVPFMYLLYQTRIIPRSISVLGFAGYLGLLAWSVLGILGYAMGTLLFVPGALFELIFPIWLMVKGLTRSQPVA